MRLDEFGINDPLARVRSRIEASAESALEHRPVENWEPYLQMSDEEINRLLKLYRSPNLLTNAMEDSFYTEDGKTYVNNGEPDISCVTHGALK